MLTRLVVRWLDRNLGGARTVRRELRHIFPDHWSFFFGEIALYCFVTLVATGVFLALFFRASGAEVIYGGAYEPLRGVAMSDAYASTLELSFDVKAGLVFRQVHHWAALVFVGALVLHVSRMFFTGAYRRPRRLNWLFGLLLLLLVLMNGVLGYSLPDDLLSGTGLRIAYSILLSIPFLGPWLASALFGGEFPTTVLVARIYPVHIFLAPGLIGGLLAVHLGMLWLQRHTQYAGLGRDERTLVGTPFVPAYALRTIGFFFLVAGVLSFLGGFFQVNPVWLFGPYRAWDATTMAQPDWYTTWLEGGLRLFPGWDLRIGGFLLPAIFWPAIVFPGVLFGVLFIWPWLDAFVTRDNRFHNLLTAPFARPGRVALGAGVLTALVVLLVAGANDVYAVLLGVEQPIVLNILRGQALGLPIVVALLVYVVAREVGEEERPAAGRSAWRWAWVPLLVAMFAGAAVVVARAGETGTVGGPAHGGGPMPVVTAPSPTPTAASPTPAETETSVVPSPTPQTSSPAPAAADGEAIFAQNCASCHGAQGEGGTIGPDLRGLSAADLAAIVQQIENGGGGMPAFSGTLSADEIQAVAAYVAGLH